jgi:hypothetical protein
LKFGNNGESVRIKSTRLVEIGMSLEGFEGDLVVKDDWRVCIDAYDVWNDVGIGSDVPGKKKRGRYTYKAWLV